MKNKHRDTKGEEGRGGDWEIKIDIRTVFILGIE